MMAGKIIRHIIMAFSAVVLGLAGSSYAYEVTASQKALTLKQALDAAMTGNPELRAMNKTLLASGEDTAIAWSYLLPKISFEERLVRTDTPAYAFSFKMNQERFSASDLMGAPDTFNHPGPVNDFQTALAIEQAVFAPKAYIGIDMAKKERFAKTEELERKKEEVALKMVKTYFGVGTAKAFLSAAEKAIEDMQLHLKIAELRYNNGLGTYSDVLRARVAMAAAQEKKISVIKNFETAKRALGLIMGLNESFDTSDGRPEIDLKDIGYYYGTTEVRKDVRAMESRVSNAANLLRIANAGYLPVLGVGASYQMNDHKKPFGAEGSSWQLAAFLRWELFDGMKREHEKRKAEHKIGEAEEYLRGMKKEIAFNIFQSYLSVQEAKEGLVLAHAALASAEEGMRLVNLRYENGLSTMVELLDTQAGLDASRAGVVGKESALLTAAADLWFQSGTIMKETGLQE